MYFYVVAITFLSLKTKYSAISNWLTDYFSDLA